MSYFANECFVCKSTETLKICGSCNMISYCGSRHQKLDWPRHKEFCNAISFILKETGTSHIYENQLNSDPDTWTAERERMSLLIESALDRPLELHEEQMLLLPRSCFVCHNTNQECLTSCPNCMCVNFCDKHESSPEHDKDCASLKLFHDLDGKIQDPSTLRIILSIIKKIVSFTFDDPSLIPQSMSEYLDQLITGEDAILIQSCVSNMLSMPLTLFNAVRKLNLESASSLILHVHGELPDFDVWELLLHFLPDLNFLKVIFVNQPESNKVKMKLCTDCSERDRKLILQTKDLEYKNFIHDELYVQPDILAYLPVEEAQDIEELEIMSRVECPLILTCVTENKMKTVAESLRSTFWTNLINYEGVNDFGALEPLREWTNGGVGKINQYMIIAESRSDQCRAKRFPNDSPLLLKKEAGEFWDQQHFFFSHICRKCRAKSSIITCKYCNMVFYCSELHRREDWFHHKDLCKVIQKLLLESGRKNVFTGELDLMEVHKVNPEIWLQAKLSVLAKVDCEMERELSVYEEQMFLFPKTCFACHEGDLLKLYICRCGIPLCKVHKDFRGHKSICGEYYLGYLLHENEEIVTTVPEFRFVPGFEYSLPNSMQEFLESWIDVLDDKMSNIEKILVAELLTRPLTLLDAVRRLGILESESIVIHVIGSHNSNHTSDEFWEILFFWLQSVNKVTVTFLGLETRALDFSRDSFGDSKVLTVKSYPLTYEQFVLGKFFARPDVIIGYDLDIHECDLKVCSCMKDILTIKKMSVPFVLTSGTKERARKDHRKIAEIFETPIAPDFAYLNPFASLEPVRDFETECLRYLNKCVVIYLEWTPTTEENVDIFQEQADASRSCELEQKLAELLFTKPKSDEVEMETETKSGEEKEDFQVKEEESRPRFSSVFAASSELKYLLKDCGYSSKPSAENSSKRRILEEPDLQFVKNTKTVETSFDEAKQNDDVEAKCQEIFESLLDSHKTENDSEMEEKEIPDVEIYKSIENNEKSENIDENPSWTGKLDKITEEDSEETKFENFTLNYFNFPKGDSLEKSNPSADDCEKITVFNGFMKNLEKLKTYDNSHKIDETKDCEKLETEEMEMFPNGNESVNLSKDLQNAESAFQSETKNESNFELETKNLAEIKSVKFSFPKINLKSQFENEARKENFESSDYSKFKRNPLLNVLKANAELKSLLGNFKSDSNSNCELPRSENGEHKISETLDQELLNSKTEEQCLKEEIIDKQFTFSNLEIVNSPKIENENSTLTENFDSNLKISLSDETSELEKEILPTETDGNELFENSIEHLDEKSPEVLQTEEKLEDPKSEENVLSEIQNVPNEEISKEPERNGNLNFSQEQVDQEIAEQNSLENLEPKTEPEESENESGKIFTYKTDNELNENILEIGSSNENGNLQISQDEDREIDQQNPSENFKLLIIKNQETEFSTEFQANIENTTIEFEELQMDENINFPENNENTKIPDVFLNGTKSDEKLNLPDADSNSIETQISQTEVFKLENISSNEATKPELELLNVVVSNELNEMESSTKNQSAIQDPAESVDLFREILLLKEEIKRMKENEKRIESENLRLKEEVNHFREERKFL